MTWQKKARLVIAVFAVAFAVLVGLTYKKRPVATVEAPAPRTDAKAVAESGVGHTFRVKGAEEEVRVDYQRTLTYADKSTKMLGIKVTTERDHRTFIITGDEGKIGERESIIEILGHVRIEASDGMVVTTERAEYVEAKGTAHASGAVAFSRGRMTGHGIGFTYNKNDDVLVIHDEATIQVAPDDQGGGAMDIAAGSIEFRRNEHLLRFERTMKATREHEILEADAAVAHLSADDTTLETMELRGHSRITGVQPGAGGLQALTGRDVDLQYGADGRAIEHALINGDAVIQLAGVGRQPGRQIVANLMDLSMAPDGATLTALVARERVILTIPAEPNGVARTIKADLLDARGDAGRGLTSARFSNNVQFSERGTGIERAARSGVLDVSIGPGFSSIGDARFAKSVRFVDGEMTATAANARYILEQGTLALTGSEAAHPRPHVVNTQIVIDATSVDITLEGPILKATGTVKSVLQPRTADVAGQSSRARLPSMLKQDRPVNVTAETLDYDGASDKATYSGGAQLWQGETQIKGPTIVIDSSKGDLTAEGPVATVIALQTDAKDGTKEPGRSTGTANAFRYEEAERRATYTGEAHITGPQGDMTSPKIELYLKPSGDELERVEAYEQVVLRGDNRKTTGVRLTYFADEGRYLVTGAPVTIVDQCGGETIGRTLTFYRTTDNIIVDGKDSTGNAQLRTQTKGKSNCPGS